MRGAQAVLHPHHGVDQALHLGRVDFQKEFCRIAELLASDTKLVLPIVGKNFQSRAELDDGPKTLPQRPLGPLRKRLRRLGGIAERARPFRRRADPARGAAGGGILASRPIRKPPASGDNAAAASASRYPSIAPPASGISWGTSRHSSAGTAETRPHPGPPPTDRPVAEPFGLLPETVGKRAAENPHRRPQPPGRHPHFVDELRRRRYSGSPYCRETSCSRCRFKIRRPASAKLSFALRKRRRPAPCHADRSDGAQQDAVPQRCLFQGRPRRPGPDSVRR